MLVKEGEPPVIEIEPLKKKPSANKVLVINAVVSSPLPLFCAWRAELADGEAYVCFCLLLYSRAQPFYLMDLLWRLVGAAGARDYVRRPNLHSWCAE